MPRELQPCGTPAAYMRHIRHRQDACQVCLDAMSERNRASYAADPERARELARERMRRYSARKKRQAVADALSLKPEPEGA